VLRNQRSATDEKTFTIPPMRPSFEERSLMARAAEIRMLIIDSSLKKQKETLSKFHTFSETVKKCYFHLAKLNYRPVIVVALSKVLG